LILNDNNEPVTVIGTVLDVTEKQTLIKKLTQNEAIYKQAEELANMGNWSWDIKTNKLEWTGHLYRIYGLAPHSEEITMDRFLSFVHPDDLEYVKRGVDEINTKDLIDYTFRIITAKGETKILRSLAQVQRDEKGTPFFVVGTERDITEKQTLIDRLRKSESLYKQAQALAHVGNWSWDIKNNTIEWSDELYRIYGLEPQSETLSYEDYLRYVHPDDKEKVTTQVQEAMARNQSWEFTHKLVRKSGEVRTVYANGEVLVDDKGQPYMMIGTAQDITERQILIDKLQESEKLFKQAQSLAHLGSWSWDIKGNTFEWSDEMYKIFEIERNRKLSYEEWLGYIHQEDREEVQLYIKECLEKQKLFTEKAKPFSMRKAKR
jgi:PAS domain S-box-containing protein